MIKSKSVMGLLLMLAAVGASVGCGAGGMEGETFDEGEADIASFEAELGEASCGTMACTVANSCTALNINQCGPQGFTLSPATYGSPSCPKQYVAEDTTPPTVGQGILPMFRWKGTRLTAANCASAKVDLGLYRKLGTSSATLVGTQTYKGVWNNNVCTLTSPTAKPFIVPSGNLKAVRSTTSATLGGTQQRVEVGFWHIC
jgi:hypothetical protein